MHKYKCDASRYRICITATTEWDLPGLYYTSNQNYPHRQNISLLDSISKEALNSHHTHVYIHEQFPSNIQNIFNCNCAKITLLLMSLFSFYHNLRKIINYNHLISYHIWGNDIIIGDCICMIRNTAADVIDFVLNAIDLCLCNVYDNSHLSLAWMGIVILLETKLFE